MILSSECMFYRGAYLTGKEEMRQASPIRVIAASHQIHYNFDQRGDQ